MRGTDERTAGEEWLAEIVREAVLRKDIISTMADGSTRVTPFWKAMWEVRRSQEEWMIDCRQHDNQAAWNGWLRRRWMFQGEEQ